MVFTAKKTPFSKSPVHTHAPITAPVQHPLIQPTNTQEELRSLESYSKYKDIASKPDTFSDRTIGRNMFSRIGALNSGCSSCGLRMKSNKPLKKYNM